MFSYTASPPSVATGRSRLNLNKRVAFPLQSAPSQTVPTMLPGSLPPPSGSAISPTNFNVPPGNVQPNSGQSFFPPSAMNVPPNNLNTPSQIPPSTYTAPGTSLPNASPAVPTTNPDDLISEDEIKLITLATLKTAFTCIPLAQKTQNPEIQRRLDTLQSSWNDLDRKIKIILYKISKAIESRDLDAATSQHRILVVDHHNACASWAPALRQLILLTLSDSVEYDTPKRSSLTPITAPLMVPVVSEDQLPGGLSEVTSGDSGSKNNFSRVYHI